MEYRTHPDGGPEYYSHTLFLITFTQNTSFNNQLDNSSPKTTPFYHFSKKNLIMTITSWRKLGLRQPSNHPCLLMVDVD